MAGGKRESALPKEEALERGRVGQALQSRVGSRGETRKVGWAPLGIMWKLTELLRETGQVPGRP